MSRLTNGGTGLSPAAGRLPARSARRPAAAEPQGVRCREASIETKRRGATFGFVLGVVFTVAVMLLYHRVINPRKQFVAVKPFALVDRRTGAHLVVPVGAEVYRVNNITGYAIDDFHHDGLLRFSWDPAVSALVPVSKPERSPDKLPVLRSDTDAARDDPPSSSPLQPPSSAPAR